jgi:hypothetical protein
MSKDFIESLNENEVRVFPPRIELQAAEIAPLLKDVVEGGVMQQVAVAMAIAEPLNKLLQPKAKRVGFMFRDPETGESTYINRKSSVNSNNETVWAWAKGRVSQPRPQQ